MSISRPSGGGLAIPPDESSEADCKVAIGTRLKRAGIHWTLCGANAIIALRRSKLSGRLQDSWEHRTD